MKKQLLFIFCIISIGLTAQLPSYVPTNGLVGWWPFNGNANDESGNGNNGTVNGATLTSDRFGVANKAYSFDGVNDYILILNSLLPVNENSYTISMWVNPNNFLNNYSDLLSDRGNITYSNKYRITMADNGVPLQPGTFYCSMGDGIGDTHNYDTTFINLNSWIHYLVVFNSSLGMMKTYKNGTIVDINYSISAGSGYPNQSTSTYIGQSISPAGYDYGFHGKLDDIAIYNRALSQQEITNLYSGSAPPSITTTSTTSLINCGESATLTASSTSAVQPCLKADLPTTLQNGLVGYWPFCGNANDASGNNNNGTVNGATLTSDRFGNANSAYSFDGVNDFISVSNSLFTQGPFSFSGWVYCNNNSYFNPIVGFGELGGQNTNRLYIASPFAQIGTEGMNDISSATSFSVSSGWHHWTIVLNSYNVNAVSFYCDGQLLSGNTTNGSNIPFPLNNVGFTFGRHTGASNTTYANAILDDIGIWNRLLTASEVQQLYMLNSINYSWSPGSVTSPTITVSPTQTTTYTCTASNSAGSSTSSITVNVADTLTWTGAFDTNWHKPCNWNPQFVPKCCNNVLVPFSSNQPVVSGIAAAEDVSINSTSGAVIKVNAGANLQVGVCPITITQSACPSLAVITTTAVSSITSTTAVSGGTITYQGATAVTARGICWSTSTNPTLANSFTTTGTGVGTFVANLTGLTAGTTYYVRAYATNASGTSYGNQVSFTTSSPLSIGQMYQGGTVVYLFQAGDPGYDANNQHGIIVYPSLLGPAEWGCYGTQLNVFNTALGTGNNNTNSIFAVCSNTSYAAKICYILTANGYSDWYLPSKDELNKIYLQRFNLSFLNNSVGYWSSSETAINTAYGQLFGQSQGSSSVSVSKTTPYYVVAIRNF